MDVNIVAFVSGAIGGPVAIALYYWYVINTWRRGRPG